MSSSGYNRIRAAQIQLQQIMEEELRTAGWHSGWRKKNNLNYWIKQFPEGAVTTTSLEEALRWEYEL